jgi:hypothetical protein
MTDTTPTPLPPAVPNPRTHPSMIATQRDLVYGVCTLLTGLGIGWFLGLATEGLVGTILTSVMTLITGAAGILAGVGIATEGSDGATRANPVLITILVAGLVGGSIISTYARMNLWPRPDARFIEHETGIAARDVNKRVFNKLYPENAERPSNPTTEILANMPNPSFAGAPDCQKLKSTTDTKVLVDELRKLNDPEIKKLLVNPNPNSLKLAVAKICPDG